MSSDFFLWDPPRAVSDDEVRARCAEDTAGTFAEIEERVGPSPAINAACDELLRRYKPLESLSDEDDNPWAATPTPEGRILQLGVIGPKAADLRTVARGLARGFGLVFYDPQTDRVVRPAASPVRFRLSTYAGTSSVEEPSVEVIADAVRELDADDWYVLIERLDRIEEYVQCAIVDDPTKLGLEWRNGHKSRHFRCLVPRAVVVDAFVAFTAGEPLENRFPWSKLTL